MKTIKITEETHYEIVDLQTIIYNKTKIRYSFNDIISMAVISYLTKELDQNEHKQ